jgi:nitrilase
MNVSVIQDHPVFFDKEQTLQKVEKRVKEHAQSGSKLIVFPESFIPGYPRGMNFGTTVGKRTDAGRRFYAEYYKNSVDIEAGDLNSLEKISKAQDVYLVIGITEKVAQNGSLYCSMVYISPKSGMLGVHRKIKPTGAERVIWAEGTGDSLVTFDTKIGRLGGLICWENYMPEARMAMYRKGVQIYIAPTADARDHWITTMKHIALEGRCFVLGCNQYFTKSMVPEKFQDQLTDQPEVMCRGGSVIVSPMGEVLAGPLFDEAGVPTAHIDLDEINQSKLDFDVNGHYARPDIFNFNVPDQPETKKE